jgi:hypothetical protein
VTIAFCRAPGSYSPTASSLTLSSEFVPHPLSIVMTNVANQDGSTRGSGRMTFNLCDYISTTGRESSIQTANGPIRHSWIFRGEPIYATSGNKDPQIYVRLYVDALSDPSRPTKIDRIRHVFNPVNGWMTVASGTDGYATSASCNGSACPAGFTNDPQAVYYIPP